MLWYPVYSMCVLPSSTSTFESQHAVVLGMPIKNMFIEKLHTVDHVSLSLQDHQIVQSFIRHFTHLSVFSLECLPTKINVWKKPLDLRTVTPPESILGVSSTVGFSLGIFSAHTLFLFLFLRGVFKSSRTLIHTVLLNRV